jgi:hypothetical protein
LVQSRKQPPSVENDLGLVDIHSLMMSLRSRLSSEVSFALNIINHIGLSVANSQERYLQNFNFQHFPELLEEILELYEETLEHVFEPRAGRRMLSPEINFRQLMELMYEDETTFNGFEESEDDPARLNLNHHENVLFSLIGIFRNFSMLEQQIPVLFADETLLTHLLNSCALRYETTTSLRPVDLFQVRKDVLQILCNSAYKLSLFNWNPTLSEDICHLVYFFLKDSLGASPVQDGSTPSISPTSLGKHHHIELAIATLSKVYVSDQNRLVLSKASPESLESILNCLISLFPIIEEDYRLTLSETSIVSFQNHIMAIYNFVFILPQSLLREYKTRQDLVRPISRLIYLMIGGNNSNRVQNNFYIESSQRLMEILKVLNGKDGILTSRAGRNVKDEDSAIFRFGGGWKDEDDLKQKLKESIEDPPLLAVDAKLFA